MNKEKEIRKAKAKIQFILDEAGKTQRAYAIKIHDLELKHIIATGQLKKLLGETEDDQANGNEPKQAS